MSFEVTAKKSTTFKNLGDYGEFLNQGRLKAWRYAMHSVLPANLKKSWIVDLGCSYGSWVENYQSLGFKQIFGIDSNPEVAQRAKERCDRFVLGDSAALSEIDITFEVIGCNGVIVHILDDDELFRLLQDACNVLPRSGYLMLSGVNSSWWYSSGRTPAQNEYFRVRERKMYEEIAHESGFSIAATVGTFIDPWAARDFEHLALDTELREKGDIFTAFDAVGDAIRGKHTDPFTELLFCLTPASGE